MVFHVDCERCQMPMEMIDAINLDSLAFVVGNEQPTSSICLSDARHKNVNMTHLRFVHVGARTLQPKIPGHQ